MIDNELENFLFAKCPIHEKHIFYNERQEAYLGLTLKPNVKA